jgi:putative endonuclease
MYYTYVLLSERDNKFYIGYTSNLKNRYREHSDGRVYSTKNRLPLKLIFFEGYVEQEDALRRERYFKTNPGKRTLKLMLRSYLSKNLNNL